MFKGASLKELRRRVEVGPPAWPPRPSRVEARGSLCADNPARSEHPRAARAQTQARARCAAAALSVGLLGVCSVAFAQGAPPSDELPSVGALLLRTLLSLGVVCGVAYLALRLGLGRWLTRAPRQDDHLGLVSTLPLGPRRAVHLIRAGDRLFLVGSSEHGLHALGDAGSAHPPEAALGAQGQETRRPASEGRGEASSAPPASEGP
jgi:flagellar biogenesis protein FliO